MHYFVFCEHISFILAYNVPQINIFWWPIIMWPWPSYDFDPDSRELAPSQRSSYWIEVFFSWQKPTPREEKSIWRKNLYFTKRNSWYSAVVKKLKLYYKVLIMIFIQHWLLYVSRCYRVCRYRWCSLVLLPYTSPAKVIQQQTGNHHLNGREPVKEIHDNITCCVHP